MEKTIKRAVAAVAVTAGLAGGSLAATAPAQADPVVPNLAISGGVFCNFGFQPGVPWTNGIWNMTRFLRVTAQGVDFPNVTLQEFNGETKFTKTLKKGQSMEIKTVWRACFPSSISGYTVSSNAENLLDNAGFWWNLRRIDNPTTPQAPQTATPSNGGTVTTKEQAAKLAGVHG